METKERVAEVLAPTHLPPCSFGSSVTALCFCFVLKGKRGNLQEHERAALQDHMLLVLEKNFQLEQQVSLGGHREREGGC